ncbi:bifunctional phosphopantothenoylcysteine decarboxylase/phosphopantothenate--cysteine ligase CoaBC [Coxiella burnetii]|uniref:bifunctional phosphopantothenoylcysteine decarboxylase/phosphopantothenate--cysteine ligase CoaBC n=1 Tax=Coxiella burnetii TaxID=777 RepID=UPI000594BB11|nr:bifunctional phosphopantothenoylcysteine decarboxylase/phosphopantothenate--cysteine ligase CoaBC [Coxiella burnetii]ATN74313.1 phosphopantothenoylcysteine decarboxylase [Coxiella burnetii]ATN76218.1 phosphopantothenoylcysteine decarboxylase [Coxiella burnetii]ATN78133.1 phosphopantothenoylcysteine decarboxylase [Coxiella burnetii]ATN80048.1 phosphopantothenoylcysteine decarboxylase [Coxiella burnetii]OYK91230.1 bifunctional phosphopantothenoylcysteine decarboxylase/phosphopantothenate--cys
MFSNQKLLIGVTGAIAAYKSVELVRRLREKGALVRVVMTSAAQAFITPLTFQAVSGHPVAVDLFSSDSSMGMEHIDLARWADFVLIAPASADFIARLAHGRADDLLTTICLATQAPIAVAPSMNQQMWRNKITQTNVDRLRDYGIHLFGPATGEQACGDYGPGRLLEPEELINQLAIHSVEKVLSGKQVLITAGPTQEAIDPVRYLTNGSSGKMGFALAEAALAMGANVTLVSGPTPLKVSQKINRIDVTTATQMFETVIKHAAECDVFIGAAAVSDYRPKNFSPQKFKKSDANWALNLVRNPDIISEIGRLPNKPFVVGFALETDNPLDNAKLKLQKKNMNVIVVNEASALCSDENAVTLMTRSGKTKKLPMTTKKTLALQLMEFVSKEM